MVDQFKYDDHYYGLNNFVENGWHVSRYQAPEYLSQNNETNGNNTTNSNGHNVHSEDNTTFENSEDDESLGSLEDRSTNGSHSSRSIGSANGYYGANGHPTTGHHRNRSLSSGGVFEDPDLEDELAIQNNNGEQASWPQVYQCDAPQTRVWQDFHHLNMQTMVRRVNLHSSTRFINFIFELKIFRRTKLTSTITNLDVCWMDQFSSRSSATTKS